MLADARRGLQEVRGEDDGFGPDVGGAAVERGDDAILGVGEDPVAIGGWMGRGGGCEDVDVVALAEVVRDVCARVLVAVGLFGAF